MQPPLKLISPMRENHAIHDTRPAPLTFSTPPSLRSLRSLLLNHPGLHGPTRLDTFPVRPVSSLLNRPTPIRSNPTQSDLQFFIIFCVPCFLCGATGSLSPGQGRGSGLSRKLSGVMGKRRCELKDVSAWEFACSLVRSAFPAGLSFARQISRNPPERRLTKSRQI